MGKASSPAVIGFLEELLAQAKGGEITEVFLWFRCGDQGTDYQYLVHDMDDMLYELGTAIMDERCAQPGPQQTQ